MKKIIITASALVLAMNMATVKAEDNDVEEGVGATVGMVAGAIAGGPLGAMIGAISGGWLGAQVNEADKVPELTSELEAKTADLNQLRRDLKVADSQLDEAKILLSEQMLTQEKVSQQMNAVSGLKFDVMFRTNSSELEDETIDKLMPIALMLEQFAQYDVQLTGHGDVVGTTEGNRIVAEDRAVRVKQSLVNAGIDSHRIHIINLGNTKALAELVDVEGRAMERRVRIQFTESSATEKPSLAQN